MEQNYIYEQDWMTDNLEWDEIHLDKSQSLVNDWDQFDDWAKSFLQESSEIKPLTVKN